MKKLDKIITKVLIVLSVILMCVGIYLMYDVVLNLI